MERESERGRCEFNVLHALPFSYRHTLQNTNDAEKEALNQKTTHYYHSLRKAEVSKAALAKKVSDLQDENHKLKRENTELSLLIEKSSEHREGALEVSRSVSLICRSSTYLNPGFRAFDQGRRGPTCIIVRWGCPC